MTKQIKNKLNSKRGASMILALTLFLICVMVSSIILAAASSGLSRNAQRVEQQKGYLAISSASDLIVEEMKVLGTFVGKQVSGRYCCKDCTVAGYIVYNGEVINGYRLDADYTNNPLEDGYSPHQLDDGHLLIPHEHDPDPYRSVEEDEERTSLSGALGKLFHRACSQVFISGEEYEEEFTIGLSEEDSRLPDVTVVFSMDKDYNATFVLKAGNNDYAIKIVSVANENISNITETTLTTDVHTIYYKQFDEGTGSYYAVKDEWSIPLEVTSVSTDISWGEPRVEKEVLDQ